MSTNNHTGSEESRSGAAWASVVVPSYNHAPFVEQALRSIFRQTRAPLEVVVVDDGSRDGSPQMIERILKDCPFPCELIARENRGLCATLNEGLARTRGKYFAYLGSDDLWLPEFLDARTSLLEARPGAVLAYGNAYSVDERGRVIDCTTDWAGYLDGDVRRMLLETLAPLSPTVMHRREVLERHGWNESARLEDYELYLRLSAEGEFAFDPRVHAAWRQHEYNTSRNLTMMLDEKLEAQRRATHKLGVGAEELKNFQALARFRSAEELARQGRKMQAVKLVARNPRGVPSFSAAARMIARLLVPHRLLSRDRRRRREQAHVRYGSIRL